MATQSQMVIDYGFTMALIDSLLWEGYISVGGNPLNSKLLTLDAHIRIMLSRILWRNFQFGKWYHLDKLGVTQLAESTVSSNGQKLPFL